MFDQVLNTTLILFEPVVSLTETLDAFQDNVPFPHPPKTPDNLWVFGVFREHGNRRLVFNGSIIVSGRMFQL